MTELTVAAVAAVLALTFSIVHRLGKCPGRLSERAVAWATNLGVSTVLSCVLSLVMTAVNVGFTTAFPPAFLTSVLIGVVVATSTVFVVFPWVSRLVAPLAAPATSTGRHPDQD